SSDLMRQGVIHRFDATVVTVEVDHTVRVSHLRLARLVEFALKRLDERREYVQHEAPTFSQDEAQLRIDTGVDHDRPDRKSLARFPDACGRVARLFQVVDKGDPVGQKPRTTELREQAVTDGFCGDTGTIGYVENRPDVIHPRCASGFVLSDTINIDMRQIAGAS